MRKKLLSLLIIALIFAMPCFSAPNYQIQNPAFDPNLMIGSYGENSYFDIGSYRTQGFDSSVLRGNVVMVPVNTIFSANVMTPLSSGTAKLGDRVVFYLGSDFYYGSNLIAPAGSKLNGTVVIAKKAGSGNINGQLQIKFTNIFTPSGMMIPLSASIQTSDGTGILKAGTAQDVTKDYVKDAAVGAAAGAVLGTAMGALSKGSVGKGAIYGTAVGSGLGLAKNIFEKGGNVEIPQGAQLNIILDQPITISSNTPY